MRIRSTAFCLVLVTLMGLLLIPSAVAQQYDFPARPSGPVLDEADLLAPTEERRLARKLTTFEDTTSTAIVVVTVKSLQGAPISDYAYQLGREWGVGQAEKDNGVVFLVSEGDRKLFIATGYGVEGALPDAIANRIIEGIVTPAFRQGQFYAGIDRGTDAIIQATKGEYDAATSGTRSSSEDGMPVALIFTLMILGYFLVRSFFGGGKHGRKSRRRHGGMPVIIWGGGGHGGGGGFSGGGGGFGGFGGGSFGGGGAGGSW